jgi:predicted aspartyl protease
VIVGEVTPYREAIIRLKLRGTSGQEEEVEAVIDTGFSDYLTLPLVLIRSLGLPRAGTVRVALADASEVDLETYLAELIWEGKCVQYQPWQQMAARSSGCRCSTATN